MANTNSQRVAAFLLAFLFLLTTVGAAFYVIWEINRGDAGIVSEDSQPQGDTVQDDTSLVGTPLSNFTAPVTVDELRFEDEVVGEGEVVQPGDTVTIHYTGATTADGLIFDSSLDGTAEPVTFPLDNLIQGWQEGIPGMQVGGVRRLFVPSALGYGEAGSGANIPPNADLVFDIELFATERSQ